MFIRLSFVALIFALAALGMPVRRGAAQVDSDILNITDQVRALDASVMTISDKGATLGEIYGIHTEATAVNNAIQTATKDATASEPFTETEATNILASMKDVPRAVQNAVSDLGAKKAALAGTNVDSIVESDLIVLKTSADDFANAILNKTPADKKSEVQTLIDVIDAEFDTVIGMFSP